MTPESNDQPLSRTETLIWPVGMGVVILSAWQLLAAWSGFPEVILPSPARVATRFGDLASIIGAHAVATSLEVAAAFAIAILLGGTLAALLVLSERVSRALMPTLVAFQIIPKIALAPLFVMWLGIDATSRLSFAAFLSFFPIFLSTAAGLRDVSREALRLCSSVGATRWQVLWQVRVPLAAAHFFGGAKVTMTLAVIGVIAAEFISARQGLGFFILLSASRADTAAVLSALFLLSAIGLGLYAAVAGAERWVRHALYGAHRPRARRPDLALDASQLGRID